MGSVVLVTFFAKLVKLRVCSTTEPALHIDDIEIGLKTPSYHVNDNFESFFFTSLPIYNISRNYDNTNYNNIDIIESLLNYLFFRKLVVDSRWI